MIIQTLHVSSFRNLTYLGNKLFALIFTLFLIQNCIYLLLLMSLPMIQMSKDY